MNKITKEMAEIVADKLRKQFDLGGKDCPEWLKNISVRLEQDGSYNVALCIPSWKTLPEDIFNAFLTRIDDVSICFRVITKSSYISLKKEKYKDKEEVNTEIISEPIVVVEKQFVEPKKWV